MEIEGTSVIVTGSSGGVGRGVARVLARHGAQVACAARRVDELTKTVQQIEAEGGSALAIPTDIRDKHRVTNMISRTIEAFGKVDVLVNNAATYHAIGALWEVSEDLWWGDVFTNLYGSFLCCRAVLPYMIKKEQGIIINMTGGGAGAPMLGGSAYGTSKAGLMRMTDSLAFELQREGFDGIQVYGLSPGFVRSGISKGVARSPLGKKWLPYVKEWIDTGHHHPAEDVGDAVVKLCCISHPYLSGRIFSYENDFDEINRRAEEIRERDLLQIRPRALE